MEVERIMSEDMKVSIITINYNDAEGLQRTLDSVKSQEYEEFEHIIIDGGSTDGSVEVIKNYVNQLEIEDRKLKIDWVSEKDKGIYDAMNKGVAKATGDYCYFLNSGDLLVSPTVLKRMSELLDGSDFVIGRVNKTYQERIIYTTKLLTEGDMSLYNMYLRGINHQSALIKRRLLIETPYDKSVKLNADWKFFVQTIVLGHATTKFVNQVFANYDATGVSSYTPAVIRERELILSSFIPERIARDYLVIAPHYYEVIRVQWLLQHPILYKIFRAWTSMWRKILK